jgi:hypothetical protein
MKCRVGDTVIWIGSEGVFKKNQRIKVTGVFPFGVQLENSKDPFRISRYEYKEFKLPETIKVKRILEQYE